jgi:hypothetical protein
MERRKQITGDLMHLIGNNTTQELDSLKVLNNLLERHLRNRIQSGKRTKSLRKFEEGKPRSGYHKKCSSLLHAK